MHPLRVIATVPLIALLVLAAWLPTTHVQAEPVVLGELHFKPGSDRLDRRRRNLDTAAQERLAQAIALFADRRDMQVVLEMAAEVIQARNPAFAARRRDMILSLSERRFGARSSASLNIELSESLPPDLVRVLLVPRTELSALCPWHVIVESAEFFGRSSLRFAAGKRGAPLSLPEGSQVTLEPARTGMPFIAAFIEASDGQIARLPNMTVAPPATLHLVHSLIALTPAKVAADVRSRRTDLSPSSAAPTQLICTLRIQAG